MEPLINAILYFVFLFGALFLILGTALVLLIAAALPVIWKKNLSFLMISLGINILVIPLSFFIGGMATDSPGSTMHDFWEVFLFIQIFPFPLVLLSLVWWLVRRKKQKFMCSVFNANKLSVWAAYYIYY
ncbi:hypothetical protein [Bacillus cereus]|uniref:hypothetical protein n=1 Tax=Bacillus cereus TaxID=1396 RepID=UPI0035CACABB